MRAGRVRARFFQRLENRGRFFPIVGISRLFALIPALLLCAATVRATDEDTIRGILDASGNWAYRNPTNGLLLAEIRSSTSSVPDIAVARLWKRATEDLGATVPSVQVNIVRDSRLWDHIVKTAGLRVEVRSLQVGRLVVARDDGEIPALLEGVAHEFVHMEVRARGPVPLWFEEGLAGFLGWTYASEEAHALLGASLRRQLDPIDRKMLMDAKKIFKMKAYPKGVDENNAFYRQVEELVRYLDERIGRDQLLGVMRRLADGDKIDDVLFGIKDFDQDRWDDWIKTALIRSQMKVEY